MTPVRRVRGVRRTVGSVAALALLCAAAATAASAHGGGSGPGHAAAPHTPAVDSADAGFARDMAVHHQQAVEMSFLVRDRTRDEEVRRLAYDIANTQANQRGMLLGWLDLWELPKTAAGQEPMGWMPAGHEGHSAAGPDTTAGMAGMTPTAESGGTAGAGAGYRPHDGSLMPGMATRTELARLRDASGRAAEVLYLQLMTDHHKGGVDMARGCAELCAVPVERRLARGMVQAQQSELDAMAGMLAARGAAPRP
ncbi:DUF305 domain-containing protein [Streptomyces sp. NPDC058195]|uniref:DUF305 domain-containing protein n=1 Tax=Streptomyces sp. NPDC058195 TaxID=3346375 RepID=UPI0036E8DB59